MPFIKCHTLCHQMKNHQDTFLTNELLFIVHGERIRFVGFFCHCAYHRSSVIYSYIFILYIHCSGHIFSDFGMSLWHISPYIAFDSWCKDNFLFWKKFVIHSLFSVILYIQHNPFMHLKPRKFWKKIEICNGNWRDMEPYKSIYME